MRPLLAIAQALFALAFTLQGCTRSDTPRGEGQQARAGAPRVGSLAPEIDGEDIDGVRFKLSDYRGKVVLLDFWGNW